MNDTKKHILQAAFMLFLQKTYKEVTMNELVKATGLSKGAFYHYFSSKEQLFSEVISHFYLSLMVIDYNKFSHASLAKFLFEYKKGMSQSAELVLDGGINGVTLNYFLPMIDALKILPGFKEWLIKARKKELNAWKKIVTIARRNGEIKTVMTDEQVAKLFVYSGDGIGIGLMLASKSKHMAHEVESVWQAIYDSIKV